MLDFGFVKFVQFCHSFAFFLFRFVLLFARRIKEKKGYFFEEKQEVKSKREKCKRKSLLVHLTGEKRDRYRNQSGIAFKFSSRSSQRGLYKTFSYEAFRNAAARRLVTNIRTSTSFANLEEFVCLLFI